MLLSNTHRRRLPIAAGFLAVSVVPVLAQEALRNAVREDGAYQARQVGASAQPGGWKAGPLYFSPAASFGIESNDNVRNSEEKEGDVILRPGGRVGGLWIATDRSRLSFGVGFGYEKYLQHSDLNRSFVSPDSELAYDLSVKDLVLSFYDNFTYSQDVVSQASLSGVANLPRYDNTVGVRATWAPREAIYSLGYAHENFFAVGSTNSFLDRTGEQVYLSAAYRFRPKTSAGLEASGALTDFSSSAQRDSTTVTFGPFLKWQARPWLGINLRGGSINYRPDPTNSFDHPNNQSSYYASVNIDHQLTDHITQALSGMRDYQTSLSEANSYVQTTTLRYSVTWALRQNTSLTGYVLYEVGQQPGAGSLGGTEDFDRIGFGLAVRQSFTQRLSTSLGYDFSNRESNLQGRSYGSNRVTLTLSYTF